MGFFLFFLAAVEAQVLKRTLDWVKTDSTDFSQDLYFRSASFTDDGVPVYTEMVSLPDNARQLELINFQFEPISIRGTSFTFPLSSEPEVKIHYFHSQGKVNAWIELKPLVVLNDQLCRVISFEIKFSEGRSLSVKNQKEWKNSSVLASGRWVKLKTEKRGIYKITFDQLKAWGFSDPEHVCLYGNGGFMLPKMNDDAFLDDLLQNPVWHGKDKSERDCVFFYATGTLKWNYDPSSGGFKHQRNDYANEAYYFLSDAGMAYPIESLPVEATVFTYDVHHFQDYCLCEDEKENLIHSGSRWFGERFQAGNSQYCNFSLDHLDSSFPVDVFIEGAGRSVNSSALSVYHNQTLKGQMNFQPVQMGDGTALYASLGQSRFQMNNAESDLQLKISFGASSSSSLAWLDYVEVNFYRDLKIDTDPLFFRDPESVGSGQIARFNLNGAGSNLQVWDVTDFVCPKSVPFSLQGGVAQVIVKTDSLREFVAFNPKGDIPEPEKVADVPNQDLHQADVPEMIIVSHPDFLSGANELASFHRDADGLDVQVVTTEQIFNEFSGGLADAAGIRNYLRMCYERTRAGQGALQYVLLLGDGSFDNRNILGNGYNFIPTYQSESSLLPTSSFVTDDFFALLDAGEGGYIGYIDLGIGRIPARTREEVSAVVAKIKNYASPAALGDWRNVVCFIGDDEDANTHMAQAESLADAVNRSNPALFTDKIYFDAWSEESTPAGDQYPEVTEAINTRVDEGSLILNYTGHANEVSLAHEKVLGVSDIEQWQNFDKLPVFVTATCEFSRFDGDETSGGEQILLNPYGGGIGLFSTTRMVYSNPNFILNSEFYEHIFSKGDDGEPLRLGDVMKRTKNGINTGTNKRNFTLLGDPAIRLSLPKYQVVTKTINGYAPGEFSDTIGALSLVTVTGEIANSSGQVLSSFDGKIYPVVYDKQDTVKTLGNGGETPFHYKIRNNVIFKGVASVTNGTFSFSFVVPKDVSYAVSSGKISYYAHDGEIDANGYTDDFLMGGASSVPLEDHSGPAIQLYLNDENFSSGEEVGTDPVLYALIEDKTGINTVGTGIGHDITAVLDGDNSRVFVLNDYFLADKDSHTSGSIVYPLSGLEPGEHTLKLKVWDVLNNSTEVEISFRITETLKIEELFCYPNPVTDQANFKLRFNRADDVFDARVEIFDFTGNVLDVINQQLRSAGTESLPIVWPVSNAQVMVRSGAYLYRVVVVATDGATASKSGKMIILRQ